MLTLNRCMQALALCAAFAALPAAAETPQDILDGFTVEPKQKRLIFKALMLNAANYFSIAPTVMIGAVQLATPLTPPIHWQTR